MRWIAAAALFALTVGAQVKDDPITPPLVAKSPITAIQGYATDGTLHYLFSTGEIVSYDKDWQTVWDNKSPFDGLNMPGVPGQHVGDGEVYQGKLYAPVEVYHSCADNTLQRIAVYNAADGKFEKYTDIADQKHEISSIAIVPSKGSMYVTTFCESYEIPQYDLATMKPLEPLKLDLPIHRIQGIGWSEQRKMFVVTSDSPAQKIGYVWGVTPQGHVTLLYIAPQEGEMEGVDYSQNQIRYLLHNVWSLDPAIGSTAPPLKDWSFAYPTTGEMSQPALKSWNNLSQDVIQVERYWHANQQLPIPDKKEKRVIFFGDSITDAWQRDANNFFPGKNYINRGISGQTSMQMLVRFRQDVIDLHPAAVVLLAGTNDIAGNTGPESLKMAADNISSIADLARANGIRLVICSVLPSTGFHWRPGVRPADSIRQMNAWLKTFAASRNLVYVDYYSKMANAEGGLDPSLSKDGVHPLPAGYAIMAPLAQQGIDEALKRKP